MLTYNTNNIRVHNNIILMSQYNVIGLIKLNWGTNSILPS